MLSCERLLSVFFKFVVFIAFLLALRLLFRIWAQHRRAYRLLKDVPGPNDSFRVLTSVRYFCHSLSLNPRRIGGTVEFFQWLRGLYEIHKERGIFKIYAGWKPVVFLCTPEAAECLLANSSNLQKSVVYDNMHPWLGPDGLLTSHGNTWKLHRKLLTPAFHFRVLENFLPTMNEQADILVDKLEKLTSLDSISLFPLASRCALDVICETAMGVKIHAQTGTDGPSYARDVEQATRLFIKRCLQPWVWINLVYSLTKEGALSSKLMKRLHSFTNTVIEERQRSTEEVTDTSQCLFRKRPAFLDLLSHHARKGTLSIEDVRQEVDTFMFAGHDTAAQTFTWTVYALGLHPDIQRKVHQELDSIFGGDLHRDVSKADIAQMKLLDRVLKETMRVFTIVPWVGRAITHDIAVGKYTVPKGSICHVFIYGIHRDPAHYSNPEVFDPDRFLPENCSKRHPFAFLPFSAGPRNCIGQKFGLLEVKVLLAKFLLRFQVRSCQPPDKLLLTADMLLRSRNAIKVSIADRGRVVL